MNTVVKLLEGTDYQGRRVPLLWREDRPDEVACFGETARVQAMIDNAVTRRILCQWYFATSPIRDYYNLTLVAEYGLAIKGARS